MLCHAKELGYLGIGIAEVPSLGCDGNASGYANPLSRGAVFISDEHGDGMTIACDGNAILEPVLKQLYERRERALCLQHIDLRHDFPLTLAKLAKYNTLT